MNCAKFFVILINIFFLVLSVVTISAASTPRFTFGTYFTILTAGNNIGSLHLIWLGSGIVLMAVGVFGLWSALKESAFMINLYTVVLSLVLLLQIVTATTSNTVSGELDYYVSHSLRRLMGEYGNNYEFTSVMNSIQKEYKCCGNNAPNDWYLIDQYTTKKTTKKRDLTATEPTIEGAIEPANSDDYMEEMLEKGSDNKSSLPTSCCKNKNCKNYHSSGCFKLLYSDIARVVYVVRAVAMLTSVLQILGILAAYILGRALRPQKFNRVPHVQR